MGELDDSPWGPRRAAGLFLGPALFAAVLLWPDAGGISLPARRTAAVALLMAVWWVTEPIPLPMTAMLPLVLFPLLGILPAGRTAERYADEILFLLVGGFLLALAMEKWNLHRRLALRTILVLGSSPRRIVLGFVVSTAFLSLWISNTATAMMMVPIALAVVKQVGATAPPERAGEVKALGLDLMLGVAYASSIGGLGTLIGTFPNAIFVRMARDFAPAAPPVSFVLWSAVALPLVAVLIPFLWWYLVRHAGPVSDEPLAGGREAVAGELGKLGPMGRGERLVLAVFAVAVFLWITRADVAFDGRLIRGWSSRLLGFLDLDPVKFEIKDSTVAMAAALFLFLLPVDLKRGTFCLDWAWGQRVPWGMVILLGGGFALGSGIEASGLAEWMGDRFRGLEGFPAPVAILVVAVATTIITEFASNAATVTILLPILAQVAPAIGVHPFLLMIPATMAASLGFMFPAGTPPNAIAYGTGCVPIQRMVRAGFVLDLVGALAVSAVVYVLAVPVFGLAG